MVVPRPARNLRRLGSPGPRSPVCRPPSGSTFTTSRPGSSTVVGERSNCPERFHRPGRLLEAARHVHDLDERVSRFALEQRHRRRDLPTGFRSPAAAGLGRHAPPSPTGGLAPALVPEVLRQQAAGLNAAMPPPPIGRGAGGEGRAIQLPSPTGEGRGVRAMRFNSPLPSGEGRGVRAMHSLPSPIGRGAGGEGHAIQLPSLAGRGAWGEGHAIQLPSPAGRGAGVGPCALGSSHPLSPNPTPSILGRSMASIWRPWPRL